MSRALISAGLWVSFGILFGRLAGFLREVSIAAHFGASAEADLVIASLSLPDVLVNLLMGGALSATLIPAFSRLELRARSQLFIQACLVASGTTTLVALLLTGFPVLMLKTLAPGLDSQSIAEGIPLARTLVWVVPLTVMAGITTARLHALNRFGVASMGTLIFNISLIFGIYIVASAEASQLWWLGMAAIAGGLLRFGSQVIAIHVDQVWKISIFSPWRLGRGLLADYARALAAGSFLFLIPVCGRSLASLDGPGQLTAFNLATKLIDLPLGVCMSVFAVILFPRLSRMYAEKCTSHDLNIFVARYCVAISLLGLWIALPLLWFRVDFASLLYGWGRMDPASLQTISGLVGIATACLPLQGISSLLTALFLSRRDTRTPLLINFIGISSFVLLGFLATRYYGVTGVMYSTVLSYGIILILQFKFLSGRHDLSILEHLSKYQLPVTIFVNLLSIMVVGNLVSELRMGTVVNSITGAFMPIILALATCIVSPALRNDLRSLTNSHNRG